MDGGGASKLSLSEIIWRVIGFLWGNVSPQLLESMRAFARGAYLNAKKSSNKVDDILCELLLRILGVDPASVT
jgi:hypothetical protein